MAEHEYYVVDERSPGGDKHGPFTTAGSAEAFAAALVARPMIDAHGTRRTGRVEIIKREATR